ncbi:MAG TPA: hypothetical protein VMZ01_01615 [Aestuariivirga sp.]|nr:hypothetical protein [Aestuariivirga sp.]
MTRNSNTHNRSIWNSFEMALFGVSVFLGSKRAETGLDSLQRDHNHLMFENRHWLM